MARQIFIVDAHIIDANGAFHYLSDEYPKTFDSKNYSNDTKKTKKRAAGDMAEAWGAMCKRDDRQMQVVTLTTVDGFQLDAKVDGGFPEDQPEEES